ncbi:MULTISPECIES: IscS subfamily cysteine desulfurase [Bacillus]|uniref:IscS subfamily cysteine desulfurase n=1 Tax=Bacillus TaxID=1386 RepID=UPI000BB91053|nr:MULTISPECIES: IscS subfamily cysteine desulfurase [Bacillus]
MIYLDFAATTPLSSEAMHAYEHVSKAIYGNTSSLHDEGTTAKHILESCRNELAKLLHCEKDGIYFTSGGTESNFLAIQSLVRGNSKKGKHIITSSIEHASIYHLVKQLEVEGYDVSFLPVDEFGLVSLQALKETVRDDTCLVSIQHGNSEIGTTQTLQDIGKFLHDKGIIFHSDCIQTFGKIEVDVKQLHVDALSISAHKIYGPKGVGAIYIKPSVRWEPVIPGGTHERGMRHGTVNVAGVAAFVTAAQLTCQEMLSNAKRTNELRKLLIQLIEEELDFIHVEGHPKNVLQNIVGLRLHGVEGQHVMLECNRKGIAISTGSACQVGSTSPSRVMIATGKSVEEAHELFRVSFGKQTTEEDIVFLTQVLKQIMADWQIKGVKMPL